MYPKISIIDQIVDRMKSTGWIDDEKRNYTPHYDIDEMHGV